MDRVYFTRHYPPFTTFYRKDLTSSGGPETLFKLSDLFVTQWLAVSDTYKMFVFVYEGLDPVMLVYDLQTGFVCSTPSADMHIECPQNAHGNSVVFTDYKTQTWVYTVEGSTINKQRIPCYRRQQLNKDSYLILVDHDEEHAVLKVTPVRNPAD
uniref:DPPIV_N domain-containing protein n=1 Tax=Bursaphelenchus xylophilus TaxID=6326 RepID=A0A1I7SV84_BURXY